MHTLHIDGESLTISDVAQAAYDAQTQIELTDSAIRRMQASRDAVERWTLEGRVVYGLTTGFGEFSNVVISPENTRKLQENLIMSHSAAMGPLLAPEIVRAMMILRINALAKGLSGIRVQTLQTLITMFNNNLVPDIPGKGSVGSSGDLAPLAHLALALIGKGEIGGKPAADVLLAHGIEPVVLDSKEGLALINGTQMMCAYGALALRRIGNLLDVADIAGALSTDALRGTDNAFDERLHLARPHPGQLHCARNLRALIKGSEIRESHRVGDFKVQDAYSLRCMPQVHGASRDAFEYAVQVFQLEANSVTDNPLVFADADTALEGGNFHGQPLAITLDFLAIAVSEIASISERRTERLVNSALGGLPRFLAVGGGLNSGMMIAQYTAASMVSENKVLAHPASVDSIPTSANQEDHNSMGSIAARKLWEIVGNAESVLAIELLCAAQGIDLLRPLTSSIALEKVIASIRKHVPFAESDRILYKDMEDVRKLVVGGEIRKAIGFDL
ncbi:MAG: histidine ammonia-lyase [Ignavibacteria bacterium]|nr:histidine ammonia-lyase [Ignavibacteria bacterium]